jgi:NAD(P)-dependent dehydrogenase (short-subunit alcohol dehydrogenase family)
MPKYTGRTAVVVGGTTGVGLAIAKRLVEGGARVLPTGGAPYGFAEALRQLGPSAVPVACDLSGGESAAGGVGGAGSDGPGSGGGSVGAGNDGDGFGLGSGSDFGGGHGNTVEALASAVARDFGTVDLLFVDAGPGTKPALGRQPAGAAAEPRGERQFVAAAEGVYVAARALAPLVADDGAIVFTTVAAEACRPGMPDAGAHAMTASAVHALTRVLAAELAHRGVRVNAVSPGGIDTPAHEPSGDRLPAAAPPLGRRGSVDEVARAALFLAVEATFTTGTVLAVDGGIGSDDARPGGRTGGRHDPCADRPGSFPPSSAD